MSETKTEDLFLTEDLGEAVRELRTRLTDAGFVHTSRVGELQLVTGGPHDLFIRTGYSTRTYRALVYVRRAVSGPRQGQHFIDFNADRWHREDLVRLMRALTSWDGREWPIIPELRKCPVGDPDWRP